MAKRVLSDYYSFSAATKTITIPDRIIPQENLLLIVNSETNTVLYNFSDPDLSLVSYTVPYNTTGTQLVLNYNTTSMSDNDTLMIMEDMPNERIDFSEVAQDPTNKLRVAAPQSLIDTDFEYGTQGIKWESFATVNNIPAFFYRGGANSLNVTASTGTTTSYSQISVNTATPHGLTTGDMVVVSNSNTIYADGSYAVATVSSLSFTYIAKGNAPGNQFNPYINIAAGTRYDSNNISSNLLVASITSDNAATSTLTINTTGPHGLLKGSPILIYSATTVSINGNWNVYDVPNAGQFRVVTQGIQTGTTTPALGSGGVWVNPEVIFQHRARDGGVLVNTSTVQEGIQAVRQTRRYFRYQSGKGIQMSSGTKFTPSFDINSITAVGTSVTVTIQQPLSMNSGVTVQISGVQTNAGTANYYNGTFTITNVNPVNKTFSYNTTSVNTDTSPGGTDLYATVQNFDGAAVRVGMFDAQNGFYFEYDGRKLFAVRRDSIKEGLGTITVTSNSTIVTGSGTKFGKQIAPGDYVVIRGQSYLVQTVDTDTQFTISPKYRGASTAGARFNITRNTRTEQSSWNMDRMDGQGPSGTVLDISKMQMCYMDYTWYGAGTIRFGFRDVNGNVVYCHRIPNANRNYAAYMRSGNLPARYEVTNVGPYARLVSGNTGSLGQALNNGDSTMVVDNATYWASSGTVMVQQDGNVEYMTYGDKSYNSTLSGWNLLGLGRRVIGGTSTNLTFRPHEYNGGSAGASSVPIVTFVSTNCAPTVSHWGTSVIMDGGYDDDRSIVFSFPKKTQFNIGANTSIAVVSIRLAPSVDNSITGAFGARDIVNRMQLKLLNIDTNATGPLVISGVLNPNRFGGTAAPQLPGDWAITSVVSLIGAGSLAQLIDHSSATVTYTGGEQIFSFYSDSGVFNYDLKDVRDLGHSVIGGDGSNATPGFPNGPDVLTIVASNVSSGAVTLKGLRISWTEAQA